MVVLGLVGPPRSGKRKLAEALCAEHGFRLLSLGIPGGPPLAKSTSQPGPLLLPHRISLGTQEQKETLENALDGGTSSSGESPHKSYAGAYILVSEVDSDHPQYDAEKKAIERTKILAESDSSLRSDSCESMNFEGNVDALVDYVTQRWRDNFVVLGLTRLQQVQALRKRPFFALVAVEAPLGVRVALTNAVQTPEALLQELLTEDAVCFIGSATDDGRSDGVKACMMVADVHVTSTGDFDTLRRKISGMWLNEELVRPSWDTYFMRIAFLAATRSNCMKRRSARFAEADAPSVLEAFGRSPFGSS